MLKKIAIISLLLLNINNNSKASFMDLMGGAGGNSGENSQVTGDNPGEWMVKDPAEALTATDRGGKAIFTKNTVYEKNWNLNVGNNLSFVLSIMPAQTSKTKIKNKQPVSLELKKLDSVAAFDSWKGILMYIFDVIAEYNFNLIKPRLNHEEIALVSVYSKFDSKFLATLSEEDRKKHINLKLKLVKETLIYEDSLFKKIMSGEFEHTSTFSYGAKLKSKARGEDNSYGTLKIEIKNTHVDSNEPKSTEDNNKKFVAYHKSEDGKSDGIRYDNLETFVEDLISQFLHSTLHSTVKKKAVGDDHLKYIN